MELYEEKVFEQNKSKLPMIIGICIGVLIVITIAIIFGIIYLKSTVTTITVDGNVNNDIQKIIYVESTEENIELYIPIVKMAQFIGYEGYIGDYKNKSEDKTKCHVTNKNETAMFILDSNTLIKTRGDSDYEYVELDEKVFEKDGELYTTIEGIENAFNVLIKCSQDKKKIQIYTMDYLIEYYATTKLKTENYSKDFLDKKAIFENMIIIGKENQYGVVNATTGEAILETKYEEIKYLPKTSDFLVKSNGKYGIVAKDTSIKVRIVYDEIKIMDNQNGLYLVKQNGLYGIIDMSGKILIAPQYRQIGIDIGRYTQNGVDNSYVLLDEIIPIKNDEGLWGFFNIKGEQIRDFEFTGVGCSSVQSSNAYPAVVMPSYKIVIVQKDKKYNIITTAGEELIPSYILDTVFIKANTENGENKFYMTYNNNSNTRSVEEYLASIGR